MGRYHVIRCRTELEEFYPMSRGQRGHPTCPVLRTPYERFISDVNGALAAGASIIGTASFVNSGDQVGYWTQAVMYP